MEKQTIQYQEQIQSYKDKESIVHRELLSKIRELYLNLQKKLDRDEEST